MKSEKYWLVSAVALVGASLIWVSAARAIPNLGSGDQGSVREEVSPIPDPASITLLGVGILGTWYARRRGRGARNDSVS